MKTAFVLSGEGARGAFQAGLLLHLARKDIIPDCLYGVSSGAINSVGYSFLGPEKLLDVWGNITGFHDLFSFNTFTWPFKTGLFSAKKINAVVEEIIRNNTPKTEAKIGVCNYKSGDISYISSTRTPRDTFVTFAKASFAMTFIVESVGDYVDGAARELAPLRQAILDGADTIYVILGRSLDVPAWNSNFIKVPFGLFKVLSIGWRYIDLMLFQILLDDVKTCMERNNDPRYKKINIKVLAPRGPLYDTLEFNRCGEGINAGLTGKYMEVTLI